MSKQTKDRAYKVVDAFENECGNEHAWGTNDNDDGNEENDGDGKENDEVLNENGDDVKETRRLGLGLV